jgi:hypothetical protein
MHESEKGKQTPPPKKSTGYRPYGFKQLKPRKKTTTVTRQVTKSQDFHESYLCDFHLCIDDMLLQTFGGVSGIDERFSRLTAIKGHQSPPEGKIIVKNQTKYYPKLRRRVTDIDVVIKHLNMISWKMEGRDCYPSLHPFQIAGSCSHL